MENLIENIKIYFKTNKLLLNLKEILINYTTDDWKKYILFDDTNYNRNLVYKNDIFEIYIICWKKNQESPIHDHPQNGCIFKVLQGSINEIKYNTMCTLNKNDIGYSIGKNLHQIKALEDSVSLHIYSPPNYVPNIIDFFN